MTRLPTYSQIPLFAGMSGSALALLGARASLRSVAANTFLFHAGDPAPGLIVVVEGRVRVFREVGGRRAVLHVEGPGGTLGEIPTFSGGTLPATAIALEPTSYLVVPRAVLESLVVLHPQLALRLLERMAGRVREVVSRLDRLVFQHVATRLARYLIGRSERSQIPNVISLGLTQQELAEELGTVREVLVRELFALRQAGVIESTGRARLTIVDAAALRAIASGKAAQPARSNRAGSTQRALPARKSRR